MIKFLLAFLLSTTCFAQTFPTLKIGNGTPINSSALLEVQGTTGALLLPRMTTTQKNAIASPANGDVVYDTTLAAFSIYQNGAWSSFLSSFNAQTGSVQVFGNDTNVIVTSSNNTHTLGWASTLSVSRGGTSAALSPVLGGILYTDATKFNILGAGTATQILTSNGAGAPSWAAAPVTGISSLNGQSGATQIFANDTNIIMTSSGNTHTLGFAGTLATSRGGTGHGTYTNGSVVFNQGGILTENNSKLFWDATNLSLGIGTSSPSARLNLPAGSINASSAPLKLGSGSVMTTAESGAVEYDGTNLFYSTSAPARRRMLTFGSGATVNLGGVVYQASTTDIGQTATGTAGQALLSGGTGVPTWGAAGPSTPISIANGGTNNGSLSTILGGIVYTDATKMNTLAAGTSGQFLTSGGAAAPTWANITLSNGWTSYSPVFSGMTPTGVELYYKRVDDSIFLMGSFTPASITHAIARMTLPTGLTVNQSLLTNTKQVGAFTLSSVAAYYGSVLISATYSTIQFGIQGAGFAGTNQAFADDIFGGSLYTIFAGPIPVTEWAGSSTYVVSTALGYASAYFATGNSWARTSSSFGDPTNSGGNTLTTTFSGSGLSLTAASSTRLGVTFTPANAAAVYDVCVYLNMLGGGVTSIWTAAKLWDGTNLIALGNTNYTVGNGFGFPMTLCGVYAPGTASAVTLTVQTAAAANSITVQDQSGIATPAAFTVKQIQ